MRAPWVVEGTHGPPKNHPWSDGLPLLLIEANNRPSHNSRFFSAPSFRITYLSELVSFNDYTVAPPVCWIIAAWDVVLYTFFIEDFIIYGQERKETSADDTTVLQHLTKTRDKNNEICGYNNKMFD